MAKWIIQIECTCENVAQLETVCLDDNGEMCISKENIVGIMKVSEEATDE